MIDPIEYYSWNYSSVDLKKLSVQDLQILVNFQDSSLLSSGRARQLFANNRVSALTVLRQKQKVLEKKSSSTPAVELQNLRKKIEVERQELELLRQKKIKIEQIETDLERKIQRQIERIKYLSNQ